MNVLVTNDDGIFALGIRHLVKFLSTLGHRVYVVAPASEQSGVGHSVTIRNHLSIEPYDFGLSTNVTAWSVSGTPADCVKIGLHALLPVKPDLVISGVNAGANVGKDVYYSGTVSGAREGVLSGIPSISLSCDNYLEPTDFGRISEALTKVEFLLDPSIIRPDTFLNVNIPKVNEGDFGTIQFVPLDLHHFSEGFETKMLNEDTAYYITREYDAEKYIPSYDIAQLKKGFITATPIVVDSTSQSALSELITRYRPR